MWMWIASVFCRSGGIPGIPVSYTHLDVYKRQLYAWFNIAANWDPYGNTKGLRVAVASLDKGTRIEQLDTTCLLYTSCESNGK